MLYYEKNGNTSRYEPIISFTWKYLGRFRTINSRNSLKTHDCKRRLVVNMNLPPAALSYIRNQEAKVIIRWSTWTRWTTTLLDHILHHTTSTLDLRFSKAVLPTIFPERSIPIQKKKGLPPKRTIEMDLWCIRLKTHARIGFKI